MKRNIKATKPDNLCYLALRINSLCASHICEQVGLSVDNMDQALTVESLSRSTKHMWTSLEKFPAPSSHPCKGENWSSVPSPRWKLHWLSWIWGLINRLSSPTSWQNFSGWRRSNNPIAGTHTGLGPPVLKRGCLFSDRAQSLMLVYIWHPPIPPGPAHNQVVIPVPWTPEKVSILDCS